jgi:nitric oxide reductase large subunit
VVALVLFLVQSLLGGKMAHDCADGASFYGFNLSQYLPFNTARTWHLQLAIFWILHAVESFNNGFWCVGVLSTAGGAHDIGVHRARSGAAGGVSGLWTLPTCGR